MTGAGDQSPPGMEFVQPLAEEMARQDIPMVAGISGATTSAQGIAMALTIFEPGGHSNCHAHVDSESALYVLQGSAHFFFGDQLEREQIVHAGDFIYVPRSCVHKGYNRSRTERVVFVVARTDAYEQQRVAVVEVNDAAVDARVDYLP